MTANLTAKVANVVGQPRTLSGLPSRNPDLTRTSATVPGRDKRGNRLESYAGRYSGVVVHVVIQPKNASNLDGAAGRVRSFELKPIASAVSGREFAEFGTVRPRVQIPGPRPVLVFKMPASLSRKGPHALCTRRWRVVMAIARQAVHNPLRKGHSIDGRDLRARSSRR